MTTRNSTTTTTNMALLAVLHRRLRLAHAVAILRLNRSLLRVCRLLRSLLVTLLRAHRLLRLLILRLRIGVLVADILVRLIILRRLGVESLGVSCRSLALIVLVLQLVIGITILRYAEILIPTKAQNHVEDRIDQYKTDGKANALTKRNGLLVLRDNCDDKVGEDE